MIIRRGSKKDQKQKAERAKDREHESGSIYSNPIFRVSYSKQ